MSIVVFDITKNKAVWFKNRNALSKRFGKRYGSKGATAFFNRKIKFLGDVGGECYRLLEPTDPVELHVQEEMGITLRCDNKNAQKKKLYFKNQTEAARHFGVDQTTISRRLTANRVKGYQIVKNQTKKIKCCARNLPENFIW
jgi:hypothetical protein